MMSELDRVVLLSRLVQRVMEREQMLTEVTRDLVSIQSVHATGISSPEFVGAVNQGDALWDKLPPVFELMVPVSQAGQGRCQFENRLQVNIALDRGINRADGWSVYLCEWFQTGEKMVFYVPQSRW